MFNPVPAARENPDRGLHLAAREIPQETPHRLVRPQPPGRRGRQLPRGPVVRPRRQPVVRATSRSGASSASIPKGDWDLVVQYDGWPNGLKIHKDGRALHRRLQAGPARARPEDREDRDAPRDRLQRGLQGPERPALRRQRRPLFHRPGADRHRRPDRARLPAARQRRAAAPGRQRAVPQRHHALDHGQARVRRRHALAADLAPAADGGRHASPRPASRSSSRAARRPRRHRDGRRGRPARVPSRRRHLALRRQHAADAPRARGRTTRTITWTTSPSAGPTARRSTSPNRCRAISSWRKCRSPASGSTASVESGGKRGADRAVPYCLRPRAAHARAIRRMEPSRSMGSSDRSRSRRATRRSSLNDIA